MIVPAIKVVDKVKAKVNRVKVVKDVVVPMTIVDVEMANEVDITSGMVVVSPEMVKVSKKL